MATEPRKQIYITKATFTFDTVFEHGPEGDRDLIPANQGMVMDLQKTDFKNEDNFAVFMRMAADIIKTKLAAQVTK